MTPQQRDRPLRIAFILNYFGVRFGGPVQVAYNLARQFIDRGHEVSYWAPLYDQPHRQESPVEGMELKLFDGCRPRSWGRSPDLAAEFQRCIAELDVVHIMGFWGYAAWKCSAIAARTGTPCILRPVGALEPDRFSRKYWKKKPYLELVGRGILARADCVHACSNQEKRNLRDLGYEGRVTVIPNGISEEEFADLPDPALAGQQWPETAGRPVALFMGRIAGEKGLDVLIPAWARVTGQKEYSDALLVIAGPDDKGYRRKVERWISRHSVGDNVLFTGTVSGPPKLALYRRADLFVLPSHSENFGIVVLEALACGTPVVTTTGTPWQALEDRGLGRYVADEPDALQEAIETMLEMPAEKRMEMGARGRRFALENYGWTSISREIESLYRSVIDGAMDLR